MSDNNQSTPSKASSAGQRDTATPRKLWSQAEHDNLAAIVALYYPAETWTQIATRHTTQGYPRSDKQCGKHWREASKREPAKNALDNAERDAIVQEEGEELLDNVSKAAKRPRHSSADEEDEDADQSRRYKSNKFASPLLTPPYFKIDFGKIQQVVKLEQEKAKIEEAKQQRKIKFAEIEKGIDEQERELQSLQRERRGLRDEEEQDLKIIERDNEQLEKLKASAGSKGQD